jgi:glutaredoxin-dependent peroxiredoxin
MALNVGHRAPNATVYARPREPVELDSYRGRPVVLMFFPLAFSGVCTKEMCTVADDYSAYQELDAQVIGISVDSPYVNTKFAESCNAAFPIVSDFNREAIKAFDVVRPDLGGLKDVAERSVFVIDKDGLIVYVWQGEHPGVFPPLDEIKGVLQKLR